MSMREGSGALFLEGRRRWLPLIGIALLAICVFGYWRSTPPRNPILVPEDDDFLSYWQSAENLAKGLQQVRSSEEFVSPRPKPKMSATDSEIGESLKDILERVCDDLEVYQAKLAQLPPDEFERLAEKHAALVKRVTAATDELARRHKESPLILGEYWDRYRMALRPDGSESDPE